MTMSGKYRGEIMKRIRNILKKSPIPNTGVVLNNTIKVFTIVLIDIKNIVLKSIMTPLYFTLSKKA